MSDFFKVSLEPMAQGRFEESDNMYRWLSREFTTVECTRTCE